MLVLKCSWAVLPLLLLLAGCNGMLWNPPEYPLEPGRLSQIQPFDPVAAGCAATAPACQPASAPAPKELALSLEQCRAGALRNNLELQVQLISPAIAAQTVNEEQAKFESTFFSDNRYARNRTPLTDELDSRSETFTSDSGVRVPLQTGGELVFDVPLSKADTEGAGASHATGAGGSIFQPLWRGGGVGANTASIRIARLEKQIVQARTKLEVIRVLAAADRAYWRFYAAREELGVRRQEYDLAKAQYDRAGRQVKAGVVPQVEITRAESGVADRLDAIISADNLLRDRQRELKRIINLPNMGVESATVIVPATAPEPVDCQLDARRLAERAVANRMEMLELELRIAQDALRVDLAKNQALPLLTVDYTYRLSGIGGDTGEAFDMAFRGSHDSHDAHLLLEVPIGNEAAKSRLRAAVLTRLQRLATPKARAQQIQQEVYNAVDNLRSAWQRVQASRRRTILAGRLYEAEQRQFDQGLRTSTDVLIAQASYADARSSEVRALTDYQIAQVDIAFATGTLLGADKVEWQSLEFNEPPARPTPQPGD